MRHSTGQITLRLIAGTFTLWLLILIIGMVIGYATQHGQLVFLYNARLTVLDVVAGDTYRLNLLVDAGDAPAWSPDGRWLAATDHTNQRLLITPANNRRTRTVFAHLFVKSPFWSLDGARLAVIGYTSAADFYDDSSNHADVWMLTDDTLENITSTPDIRETGCAWSSDSAYLACIGAVDNRPTVLYVLNLADGVKTSVSEHMNGASITWLDWIPGTHHLLIAASGQFVQFDVDSSTLTPLNLDAAIKTPALSPDGRAIAGIVPDDGHDALAIFNLDGALLQQAFIPGKLMRIGDVQWSPDGRAVAVSVLARDEDFTRGYLYMLDAGTGALHSIYRVSSSDSLIFRWRPLSW